MAQSEVIREFLVSLGFKIDNRALSNFTDSVEAATKSVAGLVAGIETAALAIGAAVTAFASNMDNLYNQSRRVGSQADSMKAFGNAARNMGVDAGEAAGNIESLATALRNNPGNENFLKSLGVNTRDGKGNLRDSVELMTELGQVLQKYEPYQRRLMANQFGVSEKMLLAISDPQFAIELEKQKRLYEGSGMQKASQDAHEFRVKLNDLVTLIEAKMLPVMDALTKSVGAQFDEASKLFSKNADGIKETVSSIATAIVNIGAIILPILGKIAEGWKLIYELVRNTGTAINNILPESWGNNIGAGTAWLLEKLGIDNVVYNMATGGGGVSAGGESITAGNSDALVQKFMSWGWTREQAAGIVANLKHESGYNPNAVGDGGQAYGIAQWHPDRQEAFRRWSGKDIRQSTLDDQLGFVQYELTMGAEKRAGDMLKATRNAQQAGDVVSRYYERPAAVEAEAFARGASAVQIAQNTTINVNGAGDPAAVGQSVANEQDRVGSNIVRNVQTAVR